MKRILSSVFSLALLAMLGSAAFAAATPAPMASGSAMSSSKMTCPSGETYVKGYTKSDGTVVKGYCRKSSSSSSAMQSCPSGETWVAPYKKSDGTMVKGYCRKSSSSSTKSYSGSASTATHAPSAMGSPAPMHT